MKTILGQIRCEKAPQVVPACLSANSLLSVTKDKIQITSFPESSLKVKLFADTLSDISFQKVQSLQENSKASGDIFYSYL